MKAKPAVLERRALRIRQAAGHPLYLFAIQAKEVFQIAEVSRVSRDEVGELLGYQREQVRKHIEGILEYLNGPDDSVIFPHALILALPSSITFRQVRCPKVHDDSLGEPGTLSILLPKPGEPKPAWIVDGQQRAAALARCGRPGYPVPVCAFVADDVATQRDQFLRINNARPLSKSLITELLPKVDTILPANLAPKKAPAALCEMLNQDPDSPFHALIRRASQHGAEAKGKAVVADTSLIKMLGESLNQPSGCLFGYRNISSGETDYGKVREVLFTFWGAVRKTWPDAWGLPPTQSRLMHSAGIVAMGKLMDRMMGSTDIRSEHAKMNVEAAILRLKPHCRWTSGEWEELGNLQWNEIQNLTTHVRVLANFLVRAYLADELGTQ